LQVVGALSVVVYPFMTGASKKLRILLNLPVLTGQKELEALLQYLAEGEMIVPVGHKISQPSHLFTKIDDKVIETQRAKLEAASVPDVAPSSQDEKPEGKSTIQYDDFTKLDIRVATIQHAEAVLQRLSQKQISC